MIAHPGASRSAGRKRIQVLVWFGIGECECSVMIPRTLGLIISTSFLATSFWGLRRAAETGLETAEDPASELRGTQGRLHRISVHFASLCRRLPRVICPKAVDLGGNTPPLPGCSH